MKIREEWRVPYRALGVHNWTISDMPDSHGHYRAAIDLYNVQHVAVAVPDVRDATGAIIHPSEYSKRISNSVPVAVEIMIRV